MHKLLAQVLAQVRNAQVCKYMRKCVSVHVLTQVHKYANAQVRKCTDTQVHKYMRK